MQDVCNEGRAIQTSARAYRSSFCMQIWSSCEFVGNSASVDSPPLETGPGKPSRDVSNCQSLDAHATIAEKNCVRAGKESTSQRPGEVALAVSRASSSANVTNLSSLGPSETLYPYAIRIVKAPAELFGFKDYWGRSEMHIRTSANEPSSLPAS